MAPPRAPQNEIDVRKLKERLSRGDPVLLLDVRTPEEFSDWRIEGSRNVPVNDLLSGGGIETLPREQEIVTICAHGNRSRVAADALTRLGFSVRSLRGGMAAWNTLYDVAPVRLDLPPGASILQLRRLGKGCLSYLIVSDGEAMAVDPGCDIDPVLGAARDAGARITRVMDTHQHADHVSGTRRLAERTGAELHLNPNDEYVFTGFAPLGDGEEFAVGRLGLRAVFAPGHTPGSTLFQVDDRALLTGDTLFVEGVGRPDLRDRAREFAEALYQTYRDRLGSLLETLLVLPGHHDPTTDVPFGSTIAAPLGELRQTIPLFRASHDEFIDFVTARAPQRPPNVQEIIRINRGEAPCDPEEAATLEEGPNRCAVPATAARG